MERGSHIINGAHKKVQKLDEKIKSYVEKNKDDLCQPIAAFITFEDVEGINRALKYFS